MGSGASGVVHAGRSARGKAVRTGLYASREGEVGLVHANWGRAG